MAKELKVRPYQTKWGEPASIHSLEGPTIAQDEPDDLDWDEELEDEE